MKKFRKLKRIDLYSDAENLDVIKNMKTLERFTFNGDVNKNFKVPSKNNLRFIEAAREGDLNKIKEYLAKGVDINVKVDHTTALGEAVFSRNYDLALYLIEQGADIYARFGYDKENVGAYCGPEMWKQFQATFEKNGGVKRESSFFILEKDHQLKNICHLGYLMNVEAQYELTGGISRNDNFPKDAYVEMRKDYAGYKKDTQLADCFLENGLLIASENVKAYFERNKVMNVEILPLSIKDHNGSFIPEAYFIINPLAVDCLDTEKSEPQYNHIDPDTINDVQTLVLDESQIPADVAIFRIKHYSNQIILRKAFAEQLRQASFGGISFQEID